MKVSDLNKLFPKCYFRPAYCSICSKFSFDWEYYNLKVTNKIRKPWSKHPYYPVASGWGEECVFVIDKEEVRLALVERSCEIVWLRVHDVLWQTKGGGQPVHGYVVVFWDVIGLEWNFDFQYVCIGGQHFPRSMDLHKISLPIF